MAEGISAGGYSSGLLKQYCGVPPTDNSFFSLCGTTAIIALRNVGGSRGFVFLLQFESQDRGEHHYFADVVNDDSHCLLTCPAFSLVQKRQLHLLSR
jgi:hypothetical protein